MTTARRAWHGLRRSLRRHRVWSRSLATTLTVLLAVGAAVAPVPVRAAASPQVSGSKSVSRWTAVWIDQGSLVGQGILDVISDGNLNGIVRV
jgi:hypothetical protein